MIHYYSIKFKKSLNSPNHDYISDGHPCRLVLSDNNFNSHVSFFNFETKNASRSTLWSMKDMRNLIGDIVLSVRELTLSEFNEIVDYECPRRNIIKELQL